MSTLDPDIAGPTMDSPPATPAAWSPAMLREIPSVSTVTAAARRLGSTFGDEALVNAVRAELESCRAALVSGERLSRADIVATAAEAIVSLERPRLSPVLNATGVIIHTNLGRAPVSAETAATMALVAAEAVALEIEPESNERGGRMREISSLLRALTAAEAALVVNNGASAVLLVLAAVGAGKGVVVSRGEAIEIGGGFRIPDVLRQSGARLVEVGTTNRTYARDYANATDGETAAYLKVHPSNFRSFGFVHAATLAELVALGRERGVAVIEDLGSGALLDTTRFGLGVEPTLAGSIAAGADLVTASGDKLLGGPQAGVIVGKAVWVERVTRHPLARAVRADKTCLAGLAETLRHYARGEAEAKIPIWRMIGAAEDDVRRRAEKLVDSLRADGIAAGVEATQATVGGGSLPGETLPSWAAALAITDASRSMVQDSRNANVAVGKAGDASVAPTVVAVTGQSGIDDLARRLRVGDPGVFGRIENDRLMLDLRTVLPEDDARLAEAVRRAFGR